MVSDDVYAFDYAKFKAAEAEMNRVAEEIENAQALLATARREGAAAAVAAKLAGHRVTAIARHLQVNRTTADKWSSAARTRPDFSLPIEGVPPYRAGWAKRGKS